MKEAKAKIYIEADTLNADVGEQYKFFQRDGITVQVPIGKLVEVDQWVADLAIENGIIKQTL